MMSDLFRPQAYHDPMLKLSIMSEEELTHIFGNLDAYIPLHEDLLAQLSKATGDDGTVGQIGQIVVSWVGVLSTWSSETPAALTGPAAHSNISSFFFSSCSCQS